MYAYFIIYLLILFSSDQIECRVVKRANTPKDIRTFWFPIKPKFFKENDSLKKISEGLKKTVPDGKIYESKSNQLGTIGYTLDADINTNWDEFWYSCQDFLLAYGLAPYPKNKQAPINAPKHKRDGGFKLSPLSTEPSLGFTQIDETVASNITSDAILIKKRKEDKLIVVPNAYPEMTIISFSPESKAYEAKDNRYYGLKTAGLGTVIYLVDTGADLTHPELKNVKVSDWIWAGPNPASKTEADGDVPVAQTNNVGFHGTGVLGKIAGERTGISQQAAVVIVRYIDANNKYTTAHKFDALIKTYDHIKTHHEKDPVIVNISFSFDEAYKTQNSMQGNIKPDINSAIKELSSWLIDKFSKLSNVILVLPIADEKPSITSYPQAHAGQYNRLVLVGGANKKCDEAFQDSNTNHVGIWAPAIDVNVPYRTNSSHTFRQVSGAAFAAGTVTGVLASFISQHHLNTNDTVKLLYRNAYRRNGVLGVPIVWNGITKKDKVAQDKDYGKTDYIESDAPAPLDSKNSEVQDWA